MHRPGKVETLKKALEKLIREVGGNRRRFSDGK